MPTFLVTTCGTSVLTNGADKNMADLLRRTANSAASEIEPAELAVIDRHAEERSRKIVGADVREVRFMSAEMNGVFGFYGGRLPDKSARGADLHYLLSTDTFQGQRAAGVILDCMEHLGLNAQVKVLDGLSAKNVEAFHTGMNSALQWFDEVVRGYWADKAWRVVLNLTGGFKAQQGIMQMLGMLYADEVGYIFETNSEYIRIPYMPVRLSLDEAVGGHLDAFRRMALLLNVADEEAAGIPEILFTREKNGCTLSFWGGVVWQRMKSDLYGCEVYQPPIDAIVFGPRFLDSLHGLAADRVRKLNERIDDLARWMLSGQQAMTGRLDFKQVKGAGGSEPLYEFDAWADQDARRVFCRKRGETVVLERLDRKLG